MPHIEKAGFFSKPNTNGLRYRGSMPQLSSEPRSVDDEATFRRGGPPGNHIIRVGAASRVPASPAAAFFLRLGVILKNISFVRAALPPSLPLRLSSLLRRC